MRVCVCVMFSLKLYQLHINVVNIYKHIKTTVVFSWGKGSGMESKKLNCDGVQKTYSFEGQSEWRENKQMVTLTWNGHVWEVCQRFLNHCCKDIATKCH